MRFSRKILMSSIIVFVTMAMTPTLSSAGVRWMEHQAGLAKAKKLNKPVIVSFYSATCGYCRRMDASTYADPKIVKYLDKHFVPVRVYVGLEMTLARMYGVRGLPTHAFLSAKGMRLTTLRGFIPPKPFYVVLTYIATRSYKRLKFRDYVEKNFPDLLKRRKP